MLLTRCGREETKAFYAWVFTAFSRARACTSSSPCDRGERTFQELRYLPEKGTWISDDNVYFLLPKHTVVSPVNSNESLHPSLRNRLVRFKRATKTVNRSLEMMKYSVKLVLWERGLIPEFVTS
ncbi:insertion element protein [Metallosphaera sedula]|nr:insertion element protein [Metallosphaera sedula]